ncbi:MAG: calcineurin-like phosphoesterase C-terminal domain-containing protein [Candidatus Cryptobacteroides sp.]
MRKIIFTVTLLAISLISLNAKDIRGSVKTDDGKALSGVVVSDGLNTVVTDKKGKFVLDADDDSRFVFISTPAGYKSATLPGNCPERLFYREIGDGANYDFIVERKKKDDTKHNLIVIADPQLSGRDELPELAENAKTITSYIESLNGDDTFGLVLGDIVGWDHSIYPEYNELMSKTGIDYRYVMGNHDMTNYVSCHEESLQKYQDTYGPAWYSFNAGKVHYMVIDDNFFIGRDWYYIGYVDARQLEWMKNDLAHVEEGATVILSMHIPTTLSEDDRKAFSYNMISELVSNKKALYALLEPYNALILSGHMHYNNNQVINDRLMELNVSSLGGAWYSGPVCIDGSPAGFKAVEIDGTDISWTYIGCGYPADYQMKVYDAPEGYEGYVIANIWDYDPAWKVEYFEDGKKVCEMERFKGYDPLARKLYNGSADLKQKWVYASETQNLFKAKKSPGAKSWQVKVTDRFGRVYFSTVD